MTLCTRKVKVQYTHEGVFSTPICTDVIYGNSPIKKGDDESIHFCVKMDREFLYVLTFLSLLYLLTQFSKKDFLKKFLASLVTRRKRSLDDIHLGAFCIMYLV